MGVTIHVNGKSNSLVHKGSTGIAKSTIPDVCKTPSPGGPVPVPYPVIISMSSNLKKGTKSVKVDGKKPAAVKGSEFSRCTGDEPGTVGGVKSSTNMKEATWILYSFDVKLDGKNACRLSDKMMMNHGNTACLGGVAQVPVIVEGINLTQAACECIEEVQKKTVEKIPDVDDWVKCCILGMKRQNCVVEKIKEQGGADKGIHSPAGANYDSGALPEGKSFCRPDIVIGAPGSKPPLEAPDMKAIYDLKFQCADKKDLKPASEWDPDKQWAKGQKECYKKIKTINGGKQKRRGVKVDSIAPTKENCS
jgi:hypothetical protein